MSESAAEWVGDRRRARGLRTMRREPGWEPSGGEGSFGKMIEDLFAEVWSRDALSDRDRRLLLLGLLVGQGLDDMVEVQLDLAVRTGRFTPDELREVVFFLTHYAGWTRGARLNEQVEDLIERIMKD
ncbi:carboxymuconolactone decarboxylase family protein [Thermopolyspora sp. NPDC052614]|uniref:carboxymuconolactone decarboxylase family protein n=1 Tax=Thermopolyspora sp. NPDC052614 TaxID=3155682 RepID=UPI00343DABEA